MYPPPQPPPHAFPGRPTSTRGPKILTFSGVGVLVVGGAALIAGLITLFSIVPSGLLTASGNAGPDVLKTIEVPGSTTVESTGDEAFALWVVHESIRSPGIRLADISVTGPSGSAVRVRPPSVSGNSRANNQTAMSYAQFTAAEPGTYKISISPKAGAGSGDADASGETDSPGPQERVFVTEATEIKSFVAGIFGVIGLFLAGIGGSIVGFIVAIAGTIWWIVRNNNRKLSVPA